MGRRCRMDNEGARIADVGEMREKRDVGNKLYTGVISALQSEGEHSPTAVRDIFFCKSVIFVPRQSRVADPCDFRTLRQPLGYGERVVAMTLHAQRQCFDAGQDQKGVERRQCGAEVAQTEDSAGDRKRKITESFV